MIHRAECYKGIISKLRTDHEISGDMTREGKIAVLREGVRLH